MRVAFDSNVLVYLAGAHKVDADGPKIDRARAMVPILRARAELVVPVQAIGELFIVLCRSGISPELARGVVTDLTTGLQSVPSTSDTLQGALDLAVENKLQFWDSLILTAASEAGCSLLLSEDMQQGFVHRGLTIVNPLAETLHPHLARLLDTPA